MELEDYQEFCRRCVDRVDLGNPCSSETNHSRAWRASAIQFHGRPVLQPKLSKEQRIEMAEQRQRAVARESERHTVRTRSLLDRVQDALSHIQEVRNMAQAVVEQCAEASSPDLQDLSPRRTLTEDQASSRVSSSLRRETLRLLNGRMERVEKGGEKTSDTVDPQKHCDNTSGEDTLSDKENDLHHSLTPQRPLVAESRNSSVCSLESCDSPLACLSLSASLTGSYAKLPSPLPSGGPLTHRLKKSYLATSSKILISPPITELEINKTMPLQSKFYNALPTGGDLNCSCPELSRQALPLARTSTPRGPATDPTHTPSPDRAVPARPSQRSPPAPLNRSYDVENPAPNMVRPRVSSGSRPFSAHYRRPQHCPEDRKTQGYRSNTLQGREQQTAVSAVARGFLTRRLLQTEKIKHLRKTIQDLREFMFSFQADAQHRTFTSQDLSLQHRVRAQLHAALCKVHEIFFVWPLRTRLCLLQQDRELRSERRHREAEKAKGSEEQRGVSSCDRRNQRFLHRPKSSTARRTARRT